MPSHVLQSSVEMQASPSRMWLISPLCECRSEHAGQYRRRGGLGKDPEAWILPFQFGTKAGTRVHQQLHTFACQSRDDRTDIPVWKVHVDNCGFHLFCIDQRQGLPDGGGRAHDSSASAFNRIGQIKCNEGLVFDDQYTPSIQRRPGNVINLFHGLRIVQLD